MISPGVVRDAHALGLETVICGWIPHAKTLTPADADGAVASFNKWGAAAAREKLRLGYHIHGYEFVASPDGTLMDTLFKGTDPRLVDYEMDIFWVVRGGGDPVALLNRYGSQIRIVHLKDIRKGTPTGITTGEAPDEASVALGTGTIDWTQVMSRGGQGAGEVVSDRRRAPRRGQPDPTESRLPTHGQDSRAAARARVRYRTPRFISFIR